MMFRWFPGTAVMLAVAFSVGGAEWTLGRTETKSMEAAAAFADDEHGYIAGIGTIARTDNAGTAYRKVLDLRNSERIYWFNSVAALAPGVAVVSGFAYGKPGGILLRTEDGGNSWRQAAIPGNGETPFSGVTFAPDRRTGYVIADGKGLFRSADAGRSWTQIQLPTHVDRTWVATSSSIAVPDDRSVIAWATRNLLVRSDDGGQSWRTLEVAVPGVRIDVLDDLYFATPERGWLTGQNGLVLETSDGGATWQASRALGRVRLAPDGRRGWSFREYRVAETSDGGDTWSVAKRIFAGPGGINAMAVTSQMVYAVGGNEGTGVSYVASSPLPGVEIAEKEKTGIMPITFELSEPGVVSIRILDGNGDVVEYPVSGEKFTAGKHTIYWNLTTLDDFWPPFEKNSPHQYQPPAEAVRIAGPGTYTWQGVWHPGITLSDPECSYPILPGNQMPWLTADRTGGWLGDHEPPNDVLADGDSMYLGGFAEGGDSLLECDLAMNKKWGATRIQLACARLLAQAGDKIYFLDAGGWLGFGGQALSIIEVDKKSKASRRLLTVSDKESLATEFSTQEHSPDGSGVFNEPPVSGFAIDGAKAYVATRGQNRIMVFDIASNLADPEDQRARVAGTIELEAPGRIRPVREGVLAIAAAKGLYLLDTASGKLEKKADLVNGCGVAVDRDGNFYVGELAPLHQVKVFDRDGNLQRTIGKPGIQEVGQFDPQNLESPVSLAIDKSGRLWVAEHSYELKRSSVWNPDGTLACAAYGPTVYGGGGAIDPRNPDRVFYRGNEMIRNAAGKFELKNVFWRLDSDKLFSFIPENRPHSFNGQAPAHPFYRDGKLYFRMWGGHAMGDVATLFLYDDVKKYARPVAAAGQIQPWMREKYQIPAEDDIFAWTDRNDDGKPQADELRTGKLGTANAVWGCRMGTDFQVAFSSLLGKVGLAFFEVESLTPHGYPIYRLPQEYKSVPELTVQDPNQVQAVAMDGNSNAIAISPYLFSMNRSGRVNWRYKCRWPGLHSGLGSTALGNEPGVLLAPLRIWGVEDDSRLGGIIAIGSNYGVVDFFSSDGFYLDRAFLDSRLGKSWRFDHMPSPEELRETSLGQEHFGGSYQKVNGRDRLIVAAGGNSCTMLTVNGLERSDHLQGGTLAVTAADLARADRELQRHAAERKAAREYVVTRGTDWNRKAAIDGFRLGYDDSCLYLQYRGKAATPFRNAATDDNFAEAFTSGAVLDLMLARNGDASPQRTDAATGDLRLSIIPANSGAFAVLYDYVVPDAPESGKYRFSSPVGSVTVDRITRIAGAKIAVSETDGEIIVEAALPLSELRISVGPGTVLKGDVGRVVADQTGTTRVDRVYWSNPNTRIVKDLPSEARLQPDLWGTFLFR